MFIKRRWLIIASLALIYFSVNGLYNHLNIHKNSKADEEKEEFRWIATSNSWLDRMACQYLGICGTGHFQMGRDGKRRKTKKQQEPLNHVVPPISQPELNTDRILKDVPEYVLDFAPLVYLSEQEQFWPSDPREHLTHTTPHLNYTILRNFTASLYNLDQLNEHQGGKFVYLKSNDNVLDRPVWLTGENNIPSPSSSTVGEHEESWAEWDARVEGQELDDDREAWIHAGVGDTKTVGGNRPVPNQDDPVISTVGLEGEALAPESQASKSASGLRSRQVRSSKAISGGKSSAPATLIVVDKGNGIIDAFWFYFYSYNLGNKVGGMHFGNHIGDWEHSLVRFQNGIPRGVFFSEHSGGQAYAYSAVEKIGKRPVIYAGAGTHALYAMPGVHPYVLPFGLLYDVTDKGSLWDPLHNFASYHYDYLADETSKDSLQPSSLNPSSPTNWFYFNGHWGDKFYGLDDDRQYRIARQYHFVNGPVGPRFKNLGRKTICYSRNACTVLESLAVGKGISWVG